MCSASSRPCSTPFSVRYLALHRIRRRIVQRSPGPGADDTGEGIGPSRGSITLELLFLLREPKRRDEVVQLAAQDVFEAVHRESDAVVGDPVLREVVRANLGRAVAGPHLRLPLAGALRL